MTLWGLDPGDKTLHVAELCLRLQPIPALLEIPSKEHPYDASKDSILSRVAGMLGGEDGV